MASHHEERDQGVDACYSKHKKKSVSEFLEELHDGIGATIGG